MPKQELKLHFDGQSDAGLCAMHFNLSVSFQTAFRVTLKLLLHFDYNLSKLWAH